MKKKVMAALLAAAMVFSATACSGGSDSTGGAEDTTSETSSDSTESYTIGISQFAEHGSLDNCREGFLDGLAEEGIIEGENLTIDYDNAQADTGTASQIASNYVSENVDLICAIATPAAMAAYNAAMNTDIPVVYTAISDPVSAELADEDGNSTGNVTGTSDALPVAAQLELIREILPDAEKIGIIYTTSETNSVSTIETYKELAGDYGFEIVEKGINTTGDVQLAAADLAAQVDCITNLTDNTVVQAMQTELDEANKAGIPVFGSEIEQVRSGCLAAAGLDYYNLGVQTGKMAASILKGEKTASEIPFETITEPSNYFNKEVASNLGITLSDDLLDSAAEVFDEITVE